ncbi:MAG: hypothetical protein ACREKH_07815, partial [Candidatus Rokuibacteriota bacterium]
MPSIAPLLYLAPLLLVLLSPFATAGPSPAAAEALQVDVSLPAREAPESLQLPVDVTVTLDARPVTGAIVRLTASPSAAFVPEEGETGPDGSFRSVMLTPHVMNDTVVAVIARVTFKGGNESFGSVPLLVWPENGPERLAVGLALSRTVLRAGEESQVSVNVSNAAGGAVENATVVVITGEFLELSASTGSTSANGSFRMVVRARPSDADRYVELRVQA